MSRRFRISTRDATANRTQTLRVPTMGAAVPNMFLTSATSSSVTNDSQHVLVIRRSTFLRNERLFPRRIDTRSKIVENSLRIRFYRNVKPSCAFVLNVLSFVRSDLAGCGDGSVFLLDWASNSSPRQVREANKRVTKIDMNVEGNKVEEKSPDEK